MAEPDHADPCAAEFEAVTAAMERLNEIYRIPYEQRNQDEAQRALDGAAGRGMPHVTIAIGLLGVRPEPGADVPRRHARRGDRRVVELEASRINRGLPGLWSGRSAE